MWRFFFCLFEIKTAIFWLIQSYNDSKDLRKEFFKKKRVQREAKKSERSDNLVYWFVLVLERQLLRKLDYSYLLQIRNTYVSLMMCRGVSISGTKMSSQTNGLIIPQ